MHEDVDLLLPLVPVAVSLDGGLKSEVAHTAVLAVQGDPREADVELRGVEAEVDRLVFDLKEIDVVVLAHSAPPSGTVRPYQRVAGNSDRFANS